jgi:hypothetical protein
MGTNTSAPKLQKRQDILLHSGLEIQHVQKSEPAPSVLQWKEWEERVVANLTTDI